MTKWAIIFMIAMFVYNIQDENANYVTISIFGNDIYIWRVYYFILVDITLAAFSFELARKSILKAHKFIYLNTGLFMSLLTVFQFLTFTDAGEYLERVNSVIWSFVISYIAIVLLVSILIHLNYD